MSTDGCRGTSGSRFVTRGWVVGCPCSVVASIGRIAQFQWNVTSIGVCCCLSQLVPSYARFFCVVKYVHIAGSKAAAASDRLCGQIRWIFVCHRLAVVCHRLAVVCHRQALPRMGPQFPGCCHSTSSGRYLRWRRLGMPAPDARMQAPDARMRLPDAPSQTHLATQNHLPCLPEIACRQTINVQPACKGRTIECDGVFTRRLLALCQCRYLTSEQIIHHQTHLTDA
jgi:hypothetical protein